LGGSGGSIYFEYIFIVFNINNYIYQIIMGKKYYSNEFISKYAEYLDIESIKNSIKKDSFTKYILIGLLIFGILGLLTTIILNYNNQEEELE
tara:strand:+ start:97 stop:372 length:276 start_codon:yes stop_codon:yes gene_type:complete